MSVSELLGSWFTMAEVKWIKITTDIFDDEKILLIEALPSADSIIVIWFKLLALAGKQNNDGVFMLSNRIAYTDEMIASIFRREINTVRLALNTFVQYGMIEIVDNVITIPNWNKHQSLDAYEKKKERDRLYQAERRAKQRLLIEKSSDKSPDVAVSEEDKEEDIEKDIEINNKPGKNASDKPVKHKYGEYQKVLLTDSEYKKLAEDFGADLRDKSISFLDAYIEEKGYKSKSHNLAIRRWVIDAVKENEAKTGRYTRRKEPVPGWCKNTELGSAELEAIQRVLKEDQATVGNSPELAERAEQLKQRLGG